MVVNEQVENIRERRRMLAWMVAMVIVSAGGSLARLWERLEQALGWGKQLWERATMRREVRVSDGHGPCRGWKDATMYVQCLERNRDSCPSETRQPTSPRGSHGPLGNVVRTERWRPSLGGLQKSTRCLCSVHYTAAHSGPVASAPEGSG